MNKGLKNLPKLVLTDIDGVWTDGGMYYDQIGNELKKFNTSDSAGVLFLNNLEIPWGIITGEDTVIVKRRAEKLGAKIVYQGIQNKIEVVRNLCNEHKVRLDEIAYIGDDIGDLEVLKHVGYSCAPNNSPKYIKRHVDFVTQRAGGQGAFREFVEHIIGEERIEMLLNFDK